MGKPIEKLTRREAVDELKALFELLNEDVQLAYQYLEEYRSKFFARALLRAQFALIEGVTHRMRQISIASDSGGEIYTQDELRTLREEKRNLDRNGDLHERMPATVRSWVLFTFKQYPKIHGLADYSVRTDIDQWRCFCLAVKYRHSIMHPKSRAEFDLDMNKWNDLAKGVRWFSEEFIKMLEKCDEADAHFASQDLQLEADEGTNFSTS